MHTTDLITQLGKASSSMSKAEARIARVILDDLEAAIHASTTEIAELASTSTPTVTRFCRTLGFDGLKEFKLDMAKALALESHYIGTNAVPQSSPEGKGSVINGAINALHSLHQQLDMAVVDQLVERICDCRQLIIFGGGGGSTIVADDAVHRFFRLGIQVSVYHDIQLLLMAIACMNKQDVLLLISTSGQYRELVACVEVAKEYHPYTVAITRPESPLAQVVDALISVDIKENTNIFVPTESRYALLATIDIIATETAMRIGPRAVELMRRIKHQLAVYRDPDEHEPLGD